MAKIRILGQDIINRIAAGEVIERPASVVKELVENSIDAGATRISIDVENGGISLIRVSDSGCGMSAEDAVLSVQRHATSKISRHEDLFAIRTLGFRGEALSSISSVSKLTITTKTKESFVGTRVSISEGKTESGETSCPDGTVVEVRDIFYNTPARRKHLKGHRVELTHILDVVTRYSLAYPKLHFKLVSDSSELFNSPGTTDTFSNIVSVYGRAVARELLPVNFATSEMTVMGYISKPTLTRPNRNCQSIFINHRYVKNRVVTSAIDDAYHTLMHLERQPVVILDIGMQPESVDVNVHPTKREVRFEDESKVYNAVFRAIRTTLTQNNLIPEVIDASERDGRLMPAMEQGPVTKEQKTAYRIPEAQRLMREPEPALRGTEKLPEMFVIGQLHRTFILCETQEGFCIIDQHAAQERVFYEKFRRRESDKAVKTQRLIEPLIIELAPGDMETVIENKEFLNSIGFEIEEFGRSTVIVRSAPVFFGKVADRQMITDIIAELKSSKKGPKDEERIATMACRASVKANDELTLPQMKELIAALAGTEMPYTCPHGRPTLIRMTLEEMGKRFKRIA